jgi:hypothetical protein
LNWRNWKQIRLLQKEQEKIKNQKNNDQIEKHNIWQIKIKWWNSKQINIYKKTKKKN